jgi:hypothetical protein
MWVNMLHEVIMRRDGVYESGRTTSVQFSALAIYPTKPITSLRYV